MEEIAMDQQAAVDKVPVEENDRQPRDRNIEDCIFDLIIKPSSDLNRLHHEDGDTWIFIKPPSREPEYDDKTYNAICEYYRAPFKANSSVLRNSRSTLILKQLECSTQQFRIIRRFGVKHEMQIKGIKFVLDLTPPIEGDEAVEIISELSCPPEILDWHREAGTFQISSGLVGGRDGFISQEQTADQPPSYTPLRHCAAIERVLLALHGQDPLLNSAPKLYTTVMAAVKHLGIPADCLVRNLTDFVVSWFRSVPNDVFIQLHPDITLKVADNLQVTHLCQDAFSILVGEAALDMISQHNPALPRQEGHTVHLRPCAVIDEVWDTRVQYARNSMVERIEKKFYKHLVGGGMKWVEGLPSVRNVPKIPYHAYMGIYNELIHMLKEYAKGAIYHVLLGLYTTPIDSWCPISQQAISRAMEFKRVFESLRSKERIFTRNFWLALFGIRLGYPGVVQNTDVHVRFMNNNASSYVGEYQEQLNAKVFRVVTAQQLGSKASELRICWQTRQMSGEFAQTAFSDYDSGKANLEDPLKKPKPADDSSFRMSLPDRSSHQRLPGGNPYSSAPKAETSTAIYPVTSLPGQIWPPIPHDSSNFESNMSSWQDTNIPFFVVKTFLREAEEFIAGIAESMLQQPNQNSMDVKQVDILLCLNDDEMKYLPLWAEGVDDGSNGVFSGELPAIPEDESFGPAKEGLCKSLINYHTDFDDANTTVGVPTVGTSRLVNDGQSVIVDRRQVYADDEIETAKYHTPSDTGTESSWEEASKVDMSFAVANEIPFAASQAAPDISEDNCTLSETGENLAMSWDFEMSDVSDNEEYEVMFEVDTIDEQIDEGELV